MDHHKQTATHKLLTNDNNNPESHQKDCLMHRFSSTFYYVALLHGWNIRCDDGISNQEIDSRSHEPRQGTGRLGDDHHGVHNSVNETSSREGAEKQFGPSGARTRSNVDQTQDQEGQNIFQIIQMCTVKTQFIK